MLPRTWEDSSHKDKVTEAYGDNDPIDAIEIGDDAIPMGSVVKCRVLGAMELIDEGETDHKIIVLRESDSHFSRIKSIADLEKYKPGVVEKLTDWLKNYKTSDGKPVNTLAQEDPISADEAMDVIDEVSGFYDSLIKGESSPRDGEPFTLNRRL